MGKKKLRNKEKKELRKKKFSFTDFLENITTKQAIWIIIIVGFVVYFNMLFNGFVWDDRTFIQANPDVRNLNLTYLLGPNMFNNISAGNYRFIPALYFTVLYTLFKENSFYYHLIQLIIHLTNSVLVYFLLRKFIKKYLSLLLALVFLIHPMQVESVSYIASADNPLFVLFGLIAILLSSNGKLTLKRGFLVFCMLLFSLFSKETGVIFIILFVLYRVIFNKSEKHHYLVLGAVVLAVYFYFRMVIGGVFFSKVTLAPISRLSFLQRLLNIPSVGFYYLKTFVIPARLFIEQYWTVKDVSMSSFYLPLFVDIVFVLLLFSTGAMIYKRERLKIKPYSLFVLWFALGLGAYVQLVSLNMTVADRWFYLPIIGILGIVGVVLDIFGGNRSVKLATIYTLSLIIFLFSVRTVIRNSDWGNPVKLYTHDLNIQDNFDLQNSLAVELNKMGLQDEALLHFKRSVELFPHETNLFNIGHLYEVKGDKTQAEKYYWEAFNAPTYGEVPYSHNHHNVTYERLAVLLLSHDPNGTLEIATKGIEDYPEDPVLWYVKALAEIKNGDNKSAIKSAAEAYRLLPNYKDTADLYYRLLNNESVDSILKNY